MSSRKFYYFNDPLLEIEVTEDTVKHTGYTFFDNGKMWEMESEREFYKNIPKDKVCNIVDIGAQSGLYTLYAKFLPNAFFYSFEPFPLTFRLLNDNIKLNNLSNVFTYNIALSDKPGIATLNICNSNNGLHTLGANPQRFNDITKIEVETDTLDNLFYEKGIPIDYLKIDTEGYEYYILNGGIKTLKKYKPMIQLEYHEVNMYQCNVNPNKLNELLNSLGYKNYCTISEEKFYV